MEHHHFDQCLMILNSPVSAAFSCMQRKLFPILLFIFSFWIDSHPYTFLSDLYSFLGKESKCSSFEITKCHKLLQVLPDKGSLLISF